MEPNANSYFLIYYPVIHPRGYPAPTYFCQGDEWSLVQDEAAKFPNIKSANQRLHELKTTELDKTVQKLGDKLTFNPDLLNILQVYTGWDESESKSGDGTGTDPESNPKTIETSESS